MPDPIFRFLLLQEWMLRLWKELILLLQKLIIPKEVVTNNTEQVIFLWVLEHIVETTLDILDLAGCDDPWGWFLPVPHRHLVIWGPRNRNKKWLLLQLCLLLFPKLQRDIFIGLNIARCQYLLLLFLIRKINHNDNRRWGFISVSQKVVIGRECYNRYFFGLP
jgi:hypothetical protein